MLHGTARVEPPLCCTGVSRYPRKKILSPAGLRTWGSVYNAVWGGQVCAEIPWGLGTCSEASAWRVLPSEWFCLKSIGDPGAGELLTPSTHPAVGPGLWRLGGGMAAARRAWECQCCNMPGNHPGKRLVSAGSAPWPLRGRCESSSTTLRDAAGRSRGAGTRPGHAGPAIPWAQPKPGVQAAAGHKSHVSISRARCELAQLFLYYEARVRSTLLAYGGSPGVGQRGPRS